MPELGDGFSRGGVKPKPEPRISCSPVASSDRAAMRKDRVGRRVKVETSEEGDASPGIVPSSDGGYGDRYYGPPPQPTPGAPPNPRGPILVSNPSWREGPVHRITDYNPPLRTGHWTFEEERYAEAIRDAFIKGKLPTCRDRVTLRYVLAALLHCTPMRVSKKYAGENAVGKFEYRSSNRDLTENEESRLRTAELNFHASLSDAARCIVCSIFETNGLMSVGDFIDRVVADEESRWVVAARKDPRFDSAAAAREQRFDYGAAGTTLSPPPLQHQMPRHGPPRLARAGAVPGSQPLLLSSSEGLVHVVHATPDYGYHVPYHPAMMHHVYDQPPRLGAVPYGSAHDYSYAHNPTQQCYVDGAPRVLRHNAYRDAFFRDYFSTRGYSEPPPYPEEYPSLKRRRDQYAGSWDDTETAARADPTARPWQPRPRPH